MILKGAQKINLRAKAFGGSNLFDELMFSKDIGKENIQFAKNILRENKIPISEEDVGGTKARRLIINCKTYDIRCEKESFGK